MQEIHFTDLAVQQSLIKDQINLALEKIFQHGQYILGPEVAELELQLAKFCGAKHAISCANGTDALVLALMAKNIKPDECVFIPAFTFTATASCIAVVGGQIVFVDVDKDTFNMDVQSLEIAIRKVQSLRLKPRAIISVDLFGQPADYNAILDIAAKYGMFVICDAAQSFGARYNGKKVGTLGLITTTSFYPAKPLGCYGDGGCIFTDDDALAAMLKSLRVYGQGASKYDTIRVGINSRLDTIQAAILLAKLKIFPQELIQRQQVAQTYNALLKEFAAIPLIKEGNQSSWAQYTIKLASPEQRESVQTQLKANGIPSVVYYHKPLHKQTTYQHAIRATDTLPSADYLSSVVLSLPMNPYLDFSQIYIHHLVSAFKYTKSISQSRAVCTAEIRDKYKIKSL